MADTEGDDSGERDRADTSWGMAPMFSRRAVLGAGLAVGVLGTVLDVPSLLRDDNEPSPSPTERSVGDDASPTGGGDRDGFYDDWSGGARDRWQVYRSNGDGGAAIRQLATPRGGSQVLSISQTQGGGTEFILGTRQTFTRWGDPWQIRTLFHTSTLDPAVDHQSYELIPGYHTADGDDPRMTFFVGVRDGDGVPRRATFDGPDVETQRDVLLPWGEDRWYWTELSHDGSGTYSATVWPDSDARPEAPNVRATGPVLSDDATPFAIQADGTSYAPFRFSHAFVDVAFGTAESPTDT